ncbi:MAG: DUF58 domain-containing protein [Phycisphaerae bacterium]|nr:DUF58 domain-containing protein [Phycisphaerae bacterium]
MAKTNGNNSNELLQYLDPKVLAKITRLDLRARHVVEGFVSGLHRSPFHGFSVEFASHREYVWGDDIRHIDWKVQAKTDRFYIKQYEEETNLKAMFLLDASESMRYGGTNETTSPGRKPGDHRFSKYEYAATAAASLAFLLQQQQDAVGLGIFDEELVTYSPPSTSPQQLRAMIHAMSAAELKNPTSLEAVAHTMAEKISRRGLVCLVSDLFAATDGVIRALEHFRHRGHEVLVLHILDKDELDFPFVGNTQFLGLENMGRVNVQPRALREAYLKEVNAFCHEVQRKCVASRIDYKRISTADSLDAALCAFLAARAAAVRKTSAKR